MSQHDMIIANQSFANFRTDLNNGLQALASMSSGANAPSTPYAGQMWIDTTTATAWQPKIYDGAAWINLPFFINTATNDANLTTSEVTSLVVESDPQSVALAIALG